MSNLAAAQWYNCYNDTQVPTAICDAHTVVSLNNDGVATVYASTFDDGSYDNCEISHFLAARMTPGWCPYGVIDDTQFRPYVQFCCEDVTAGPIWIIFRVVDVAGNYNDCMVEVTVQDKLDPWITCPPDITVSCEFWFSESALWDPWDRTFGTVVKHPSERLPVIINDPGNDWYYQPHNWGLDGYATDNCDVWIDIADVINIDGTCGNRTIKRIWRATDWGGRTKTCTQKITVKDYYPFSGYSIKWPWDYEADGCDVQYYDPEFLPPGYDKPTWNDNSSCSLIGIAYEDKVFTFVEGACKKILRKWSVIDWCQYDPHHPYYGGLWEHTQVIKLANHDAPTIENCYDVTVNGLEPNCKADVWLDPMAWDDCTPKEKLKYEYKIDLWYDGSMDIIRKDHPVLHETLPVGVHRVWWFIDDGCGNLSSCQFKLTIVDGKKPTPVCYYGLSSVVMPQGGMVTIWAKDFNASSFDNCTPANKLKYSFSPNVLEASRTFTCDDIGTVTLQIWVTDLAGNQDYCTTFINIDDNENVCEEMNPLTGLVSSMLGNPVEDAEVMLYKIMPSGDHKMDRMKLSDEDGAYVTGFGTTQYDRYLMAQKQDDLMNGVSALDLILLQSHLIGYQPFESSDQYLAADLDKSRHVGIMDMIRLRDILIGLPATVDNLPWLIYPKSCQLPPVSEPFNLTCEGGYTVDHTNVPGEPFDFLAIKVGDINGDVEPGGIAGRSSSTIPVIARWKEARGQGMYLEFVVNDNLEYKGLQISVRQPQTNFNVLGGELQLDPGMYRYTEEDGYLNLVHTVKDQLALQRGDVLFTLYYPGASVQLMQNELDLFKGRLNPEMYTAALVKRSITVIWEQTQTLQNILRSGPATKTLAVSAAPNPFVDMTELRISTDVAASAHLTITDVRGQLVLSRDFELTAGQNTIEITGTEIGIAGLYLYHLNIDGEIRSGKLLYSN